MTQNDLSATLEETRLDEDEGLLCSWRSTRGYPLFEANFQDS